MTGSSEKQGPSGPQEQGKPSPADIARQRGEQHRVGRNPYPDRALRPDEEPPRDPKDTRRGRFVTK